jgi:hypothetical protein
MSDHFSGPRALAGPAGEVFPYLVPPDPPPPTGPQVEDSAALVTQHTEASKGGRP